MEGESLANMMKRLKGIFLFTALSAFMLMISPDAGAQQKKGEPWIIPPGYKVMTNPLAADSAIIRAGQLAYDRKCALCHGKRGLGDGPRGKMSKIFPGDLSGQEFRTCPMVRFSIRQNSVGVRCRPTKKEALTRRYGAWCIICAQ